MTDAGKGFMALTEEPKGYAAWLEAEFMQQVVAQLPWFHLCTLPNGLKTSLPSTEATP